MEANAQSLVILASFSGDRRADKELLTHKMSTHSVLEATRCHRPIEVISYSPGRNADRNVFTRLVSPSRGNTFILLHFYKTNDSVSSAVRVSESRGTCFCMYAAMSAAVRRNAMVIHYRRVVVSSRVALRNILAGANFIRLYWS